MYSVHRATWFGQDNKGSILGGEESEGEVVLPRIPRAVLYRCQRRKSETERKLAVKSVAQKEQLLIKFIEYKGKGRQMRLRTDQEEQLLKKVMEYKEKRTHMGVDQENQLLKPMETKLLKKSMHVDKAKLLNKVMRDMMFDKPVHDKDKLLNMIITVEDKLLRKKSYKKDKLLNKVMENILLEVG